MVSTSGYMSEASDFEDSLSEDEDEDINCAIELSILESNRTGASSAGTGRRWWRTISSSLNIIKKFKQFGVTSSSSWTSSTWQREINDCTYLVCDVCNETIRSKWLCRPYWGQNVCLKHSSDGTPRCCCCVRFQLGNTRYFNLSDGRKLCPDCHCTAIMDTEKCIPIFHEVYRFFDGLNMNIIRDIPIFLVDQDEMNKFEHRGEEMIQLSQCLGMTTLRAEVVTSVARSSQMGQNIKVVKEVQYIPRIYEVTSMLLLYGFPKLAIGATLAHEMMHAWIRVEGFRGLRLEVEEGICEVMAHRWLDWHAFVGDDFLCSSPEQSQFLRNLKEFLKEDIEQNYCKIYGGGFRDAKWAVERYGLKYTMNHIAHTGNFPE